MTVHTAYLVYAHLEDNADKWVNSYLENRGLGQECLDDIHTILLNAIVHQFSNPVTKEVQGLMARTFGTAAEMLNTSPHTEAAVMKYFLDDPGAFDGLATDELFSRIRKITDNVIGMLNMLSRMNAEDVKIQENIGLNNTWYYILGLSFANGKGNPYPLPTLGQARKLTNLINDCVPRVTSRFPELFIGRKKPDFEAENPIISRQMRAGYKAGLSLSQEKWH